VKEIINVESVSSSKPDLLDAENTPSESHHNPKGILLNETAVELGQSDAILEPQSSAKTASLDQASLQDEEGLPLERRRHEIAPILTESPVALAVCFLNIY
jgi:hypothetical protein